MIGEIEQLIQIFGLNKTHRILGVDQLTLKGILKGNNPQKATLIKIRSGLDKFTCGLSDLNCDLSEKISLMLKTKNG